MHLILNQSQANNSGKCQPDPVRGYWAWREEQTLYQGAVRICLVGVCWPSSGSMAGAGFAAVGSRGFIVKSDEQEFMT